MSTTVEHRINILSSQIDRLADLCQMYEGEYIGDEIRHYNEQLAAA